MSSMDYGPCTVEAYRTGEANRVSEHELSQGALYVARFIVNERMNEKAQLRQPAEAYQMPARINGTEESDHNMQIVSFELLGPDLQLLDNVRGFIRNGYLLARGQDNRPTEHGYFKGYHSGCDELDRLVASCERSLVIPEAPEQDRELIPA